MSDKRSWQSFGIAILTVGVAFIFFAITLAKPDEIVYVRLLFFIGAALAAIGVAVLVWDWKRRKNEK